MILSGYNLFNIHGRWMKEELAENRDLNFFPCIYLLLKYSSSSCNTVSKTTEFFDDALQNFSRNWFDDNLDLPIHLTALSRVRICRPPSLSFAPALMKDAECAKLNEKSIYRSISFWVIVKTHQNWKFFSPYIKT